MALIQVNKLYTSILSWVIPPTCPVCRVQMTQVDALCQVCWQGLVFVTAPHCQGCGWPLVYDDGVSLCLACMNQSRPFVTGRSAFCYEGIIRDLILRFKHNNAVYLVPFFVRWLLIAGSDLFNKVDYIVSVPLHRWRLWRRGYNQSTLLARSLARQAGLVCLTNVLIRKRRTESQSHKTKRQRQKNIQGAFAIKKEKQYLIKGKRVLLIDDVWTTGATLSESALALKRAGAKEISVLTLARVVKIK